MTVAIKDENSFHQIFQSIPNDEKLIEEYSCSYTDGGSVSIGRLYISQQHVSYAPKLGSTQIMIPIKDITNISKKYSVYLFPNAIEVSTTTQKYFFSAFLSRDLAFATLQTLFQQGGGTRTKIFEDAMNGIIYDEKAGKSEEIELEEPFQETPTISSFTPTTGNSLSSSTSQLEPPAQANSQESSQQNSSGSNTPKSQSPSSMIESNDSTVTPQGNQTEPDENIVVGNHSSEEQTTNTTSASLPPTPKKSDSQLNLSDLSTPNKPPTQFTKASPSIKRKNTVDSITITQNTTPSLLRHTISTSSVSSNSTASSSTSTATTSSASASTSSPSPASVATSNTLQFKSIPIKDKCEHIVATEFEEAPWATEKYPISVEEFYNVIIRTDFWALVNTTHGYTEQTVHEWKTGTCCTSRAMDFRTAISFKIGPKSTRVFQTQRCRLKNKDELLLECSSISKDVPYGDSFSVENLLSIVSDDGGNGCIVKLSSKIKFTKTLWGIASMIQKSAYQGNKEYFVLWSSMVRNQIEAYTYNKLKQAKSALPDPQVVVNNQAAAIPASVANVPVNSVPTTVITQPKDEPTPQAPSVPSNLSLTTLWTNLSSTEKQISMVVMALIAILFFGLVINVYSTSRSNQWLNQELYKFSDSIVLLDSKLNSLMQDRGPVTDEVIIANGNIGTDRLEILQKKLDIASSLLQRTQSLISNLQGELSIEALKVKKFEEAAASGGWSPYVITLLVVVGSALHFTGLLQPIRDLLPI